MMLQVKDAYSITEPGIRDGMKIIILGLDSMLVQIAQLKDLELDTSKQEAMTTLYLTYRQSASNIRTLMEVPEFMNCLSRCERIRELTRELQRVAEELSATFTAYGFHGA